MAIIEVAGLKRVYQSSGGVRTVAPQGVDLSVDAGAEVRNAQSGFVCQQFDLLPRTSVLANVLFPAQYHEGSKPLSRALEVIEQVGLVCEVDKKSNQLSGGQMQRVAIARAPLYSPSIILADEPTGNLDSHMAADIMAILAAAKDAGATVVLITHEDDIAASASRRIRMRDGRIVSDPIKESA